MSLEGYESTWNGEVIGIAKDGHPIYGPKDSTGTRFACGDTDLCNGKFFGDGHYGYVSVETFPYVLGCYGPAAPKTHSPTCTNFKCTDGDISTAEPSYVFSGANALLSSVLAYITLSLF